MVKTKTDVEKMSKTQVLRELNKYSNRKPKIIKATYIKTIKPSEIFEDEKNETTDVYKVKYANKIVNIPIIKSEKEPETLTQKLINQLSKSNDKKTREIVEIYKKQTMNEKLKETPIQFKAVPEQKETKKEDQLMLTYKQDDKKEDKDNLTKLSKLSMEELKPEHKKAMIIINEMKKRLLIPFVNEEVDKIQQQNPELTKQEITKIVEKQVEKVEVNINDEPEDIIDIVKEEVKINLQDKIDEVKEKRKLALEKAREAKAKKYEEEEPKRLEKKKKDEETKKIKSILRDIRKKIKDTTEDFELSTIYSTDEFKIFKDRKKMSKQDEKLIQKTGEAVIREKERKLKDKK